jgi:Icc-related predicted phosphoesterase
VHGHAHHGQERGMTARGVPVRNVALPLLRRPYAVFYLEHTPDKPAPFSEWPGAPPAGPPRRAG